MEESALHRALVLAASLQAIPAWLIAAAVIFDAAIAGVCWLGHGIESAAIAAGAVLIFGFVNWWFLRRLVTTKRSFGPDKPSALALGAVGAIITAVLGFVGLPLILVPLLLIALTLVAYYATWIEPFRIGVTRQQYIAKAWTVCMPLRLLHVGDIHVERITDRERKLNALIEQLHPDVIVFSGDFVNLSYTHDEQTRKDIREIVGAWRAPLGVYCVPGTPMVEPMERVLSFVEGLDNVTLLANSWAKIEHSGGELHILGLVTTHDLNADRSALKRLIKDTPEGGLALLLTHSPDIAPEAAEVGFDLYMCGHTHGGQIRLPGIGALISSSHHGNRFVMGRYEVGGMTLYTSRGVGLEGLGAPRARFLCPPEIILWEIGGC